MIRSFWFFAFLVAALRQEIFANALVCYECGIGCIPTEMGTPIECDKTYCTVYRREYVDPPGVVEHFYRSCESNPTYLNTEVETADHRSYYSSCRRDLCNVGEGRVPFVDSRDIQNSSDSRIYYVPGIGSSCDRLIIFPGLVIFALVLSMIGHQ